MTPIYVLAALAAITGYLIYYNIPVYLKQYGVTPFSLGIAEVIIPTAIIIAGIFVSYWLFYRGRIIPLWEE